MSVAATSAPAPTGVARSASATGARAVLQPDVSLWLWQRHLPTPTAEQALAVARRTRGVARAEVDVGDRVAAVEELLARLDPAGRDAHGALAQDVAALAFLLARLAGHPRVAVRMESDPGAGCPLLHVDSVALRLLCTYTGTGTAWLADADVVRGELGLRGRTPERANAAIAPDRTAIRHLAPGEVAILKGSRFPGCRQGLVHRSPTGTAPRLLVAVDLLGPPAPILRR